MTSVRPRQRLLRALSSVLRHRQRKTEGGSRGFAGASCIAQGGIAKGGIGNTKEKGGVAKGFTKEGGIAKGFAKEGNIAKGFAKGFAKGVHKSKGLRSELSGQQQLFPRVW